MSTILITGGAGFIGSHLADRLLARGHVVRALDSLDAQVHGTNPDRPDYLDPRVELLVGDVRDAKAVTEALAGVDAVFHFAARVGVGQSMYEIERYTSVNDVGTAVLLEQLLDHPIEKLIVASSMSIYGEGLYRDATGRLHHDVVRTREQLERRRWDPHDEQGQALQPLPTPENKVPNLSSVYALSKFDQERLCLMFGQAYRIPTIALRFFNVYGPRQALSNPYTGVLAIFASRLLNDKPPLIFENGLQRRDFVSVYDVADACVLALESDVAGEVFNIGSGRSISIVDIAHRVATALARPSVAEVTARFRAGDIRHCFADISRAREVLGYEPKVDLDDGLGELAEWLRNQKADDRVDEARSELTRRGLTV